MTNKKKRLLSRSVPKWLAIAVILLVPVITIIAWFYFSGEKRTGRSVRVAPAGDPSSSKTLSAWARRRNNFHHNPVVLLKGTWEELHQQGLKALEELRLDEADLAFESAAAVTEEQESKKGEPEQIENPQHGASMAHLIKVKLLRGQYKQADSLATRWPEENDPNWLLRSENRAVLYLEIDDTSTGAEHLAGEAGRRATKAFSKDSVQCARFWSLESRAAVVRFGISLPQFPMGKLIDFLVRKGDSIDDLDKGFILYNLGLAYRYSNRLSQAEEYLCQAVDCLRRSLANGHPETAAARYALAECRMRQGRFEQVDALLNEALAVREKFMGPEHFKVADVLAALGEVCQKNGDHEKAGEGFERAIAIYRAHLRDSGRSSGIGRLRRKPNWRQYWRTPTKLHISVDNPIYLRMASVNVALARNYQLRDRQIESVKLLEDAICIYMAALRSGTSGAHPNKRKAAPILRQLARAHLAMGQHDEALEVLEMAHDFDKSSYGSYHPQCTLDIEALAKVYRQMGKNDLAEPLEQKAIQIRLKFLGEAESDPDAELLWEAKIDAANERYDAALSKMAERAKLRRPRLARLLPALGERQLLATARQEAWYNHYMISLASRCINREQAARHVLDTEMAYKSMAIDGQASLAETVHTSNDPELKKQARAGIEIRRFVKTDWVVGKFNVKMKDASSC